MADTPVPEVGPEQIDAVLAFLPVFTQPGISFGEWRAPEGQMPYYADSREVRDFVAALYKHRFVVSFDWPSWQDEAKRLMNEPGALAEADLLTLRKLLTTHVRADRFNEGHLGSVLESGHVAAILRRLQVIREGMG